MAKLLIVDDEQTIRNVLILLFQKESHETYTAENGAEALTILEREDIDLMLSDIRMSPMDGIELLKVCREKHPSVPVVMMTAYGSTSTAAEALKLGAFDYVTKPFRVEDLFSTVEHALASRSGGPAPTLISQDEARTHLFFEHIVAASPASVAACEMAKRVIPVSSPVLIHGERGSGKETIARAIHNNGARKDKKLLAINCADVPEPILNEMVFGHMESGSPLATASAGSLLEKADGGSILFQEADMMPLSTQEHLYSLMHNKAIPTADKGELCPIDVRIFVAANRQLGPLVKQGTFRNDLFALLSAFTIEVMPLRQRREDTIPLVYHILQETLDEAQPEAVLSPGLLHTLSRYPWPGNVAELRTVIEDLAGSFDGDTLTEEALPQRIRDAAESAARAADSANGANQHRATHLRAFLQKSLKNRGINSLG